MFGGADAWLIIDDTALAKKGEHSVGVTPQYASSLGKTANCQSLVSVLKKSLADGAGHTFLNASTIWQFCLGCRGRALMWEKPSLFKIVPT